MSGWLQGDRQNKLKKGGVFKMDWYLLIVVLVVVAGIIYFLFKKKKK
jgi:LPXTG-motif cell wall-anchored protein